MIRRHLSIFSYTWSFQVIFHCDIIHLLKGLRKLFYCMLISHTPENKLEKSSFFFDSFVYLHILVLVERALIPLNRKIQ